MIEVSKDTLYVRGEDGTYKPVNVFGSGGGAYVLPTASADMLGGVKVGDGLQMIGDVLGVKPEGAYELIETITLEDGETGSVSRTMKPDGTPYNFKAIWVCIEVPAADSQQYVQVLVKTSESAGSVGMYQQDGIKTIASKWHVFITPEYGRLMFKTTSPVVNDYDVPSYWRPADYRTFNKLALPIHTVIINAKTAFPAGTKIEILGVRSDA